MTPSSAEPLAGYAASPASPTPNGAGPAPGVGSPPLSPVLLAGFAMRPLPLVLLGRLLNVAMATMRRRHPEVFTRLESLGDAEFLIDPIDLPFGFLLRPGGPQPRLTPVRDGDDPGPVAASIRGPLLALIDLLEGRRDGDALFFSRDLVIEGDTEAVLTLRNAVDGSEIHVLDDLLAPLGPFYRPARQGLGLAGLVFTRAARDLEILRAAFVAPLARRCQLQAASLREIEADVAQLRRRLSRERSRGRPAADGGGGKP